MNRFNNVGILAVRKIRPIKCDAENTSANPFLVFIAVTLFTILAIGVADVHRDTLKMIGVAIGGEGIDVHFVSP